jgi:hypothetical protein
MSKFDELKKQHKDLALNDLDLMKMAVPDQASKYVEVLAKLAKSKYKEIAGSHGGEDILRKACLSTLADWGIDYNYLETLETPVLWAMWNRMETLLGSSSFRLFLKFANLNERKLIDNNDVTSYKSFDEIEQAVSLAEMKLIDKELEKQIKKVYEDDEWLSLRPLSLEASMKYGANTKWCTTTNTGQYYARYSSRGVLIYNINKKTGYKVACFKNLSPDHDNEFSWWDVTDRKIEVLDSEAPLTVLEAVRNEIKNHPYYNSHLMSDDEQAKLNQYKEGYGPAVDSGTRLNITGGFASSIGTGNNFTYSTSTNTGNILLGTTTPTTQLSISGNVEINDGDLILRSNGEERMRITATGGDNIPVYRGSQALEQALNGEQPDERYRVDEARERLEQEIEAHLGRATERVNEERAQQQTLLGDLELGTLSEDYKRRMQMLAGIDINGVTVKLNGVEIVDEEMEAEQTDVPLVEKKRKSGKNWINKLWSKL